MFTWNYSESDELWQHDEFKTEEECILDAKENYEMKVGDEIAIGTIYPYRVIVDVDRMLESIEEEAYEECGEVSESWNISSRKLYGKEIDELQEKVTKLVEDYLIKIKENPNFYKIGDTYTVTIN